MGQAVSVATRSCETRLVNAVRFVVMETGQQ
jgi:hypothetical protein